MRVAPLDGTKAMKQYLKRLFDVKKDGKKTNVIELNGSRFVEIAHHRPTPIFLAESLLLDFVEPFKQDKACRKLNWVQC